WEALVRPDREHYVQFGPRPTYLPPPLADHGKQIHARTADLLRGGLPVEQFGEQFLNAGFVGHTPSHAVVTGDPEVRSGLPDPLPDGNSGKSEAEPWGMLRRLARAADRRLAILAGEQIAVSPVDPLRARGRDNQISAGKVGGCEERTLAKWFTQQSHQTRSQN